MKHLKNDHSAGSDDVDQIVAALIADPTRADDIKEMLRRKILAPDAVRVVLPFRPRQLVEDDADELWDNVPV
jgi:hypothetical protein